MIIYELKVLLLKNMGRKKVRWVYSMKLIFKRSFSNQDGQIKYKRKVFMYQVRRQRTIKFVNGGLHVRMTFMVLLISYIYMWWNSVTYCPSRHNTTYCLPFLLHYVILVRVELRSSVNDLVLRPSPFGSSRTTNITLFLLLSSRTPLTLLT